MMRLRPDLFAHPPLGACEAWEPGSLAPPGAEPLRPAPIPLPAEPRPPCLSQLVPVRLLPVPLDRVRSSRVDPIQRAAITRAVLGRRLSLVARFARFVSALLLAALPTAASADAPSARFAVVANATTDGKADDAAPIEALLADVMVKKGQRLVDSAQAEKVRQLVAADEAAAGRLPPGLSSMDADWVLAATATCRTLATEIRPTPTAAPETIHAANCDASVALVRLDTGDVAGKASIFGKGPAATPREAVRRAYERIARAFESEHAAAFIARASERRPIAVWLFGAEERAIADRVREGLSKLAGVTHVAIVEFGPELTRLEVATDAGTGLDLARAVERSADLAVHVERASGGRLSVRFDPAGSFRTTYTVRPFADRTGDKRLARDVRGAHARLAALLANGAFLAPAANPASAEVVVEGSVTLGPDGQPRFRVVAAPAGGGPTAQTTGIGAFALDAVATTLEDRLAVRLAALNRSRRQGGAGWAGLPDALERSRKARPVRVARYDAPDLFPARLARYAEDLPVGALFVESRSGKPVEGVVARAELDGFSAGPRLAPPAVVPPKGAVAIPLWVALDGARLAAVAQATVAQLKVELSWRQGEVERAERFVIPLRVQERNAVDWRDAASAAAFVQPRDESVRELASAALAVASSDADRAIPRNVERAARIVEAIAAQKIRYVPDPVVPYGSDPVDFVNFPRETLARKTGDCDDLAVLAASALEAAGIATRLLTTPGHILVAYDAGAPSALAAEFAFDEGKGIAVDDRTFVPLEATAIGKGYLAAWELGAREVRRHRGSDRLALLDVRDAWRRYPPLAASPEATVPTGADPGRPRPGPAPAAAPAAAASAESVLAALRSTRQKALDDRLARIEERAARSPRDVALANERALVLAAAGRLDDAAQAVSSLAETDAAVRLTFANVLALKGDLATAEKMLADGPGADGARVAALYHHNRAIVRFLARDDAGAAESLAAALALDPALARGLTGDMPESGRATDAAPTTIFRADLVELLRRAQERATKKVADAPPPAFERAKGLAAGRRGDDPESRQLVAATLRWPAPPSAGEASPPRAP